MDNEDYDAAIFAALENSPDASTAYPYGVYDGNAPMGVDVPHLIIMTVSDTDSPNLGDTGVWAILYLIRATGRTRTEANAALAAAHRALYAARPLTVPGYVELHRGSGGQMYKDSDGFLNAAAYYRLTVTY